MLYLITAGPGFHQVRQWAEDEITIGALADGPFMDAWESEATCVVMAWVKDPAPPSLLEKLSAWLEIKRRFGGFITPADVLARISDLEKERAHDPA